VIRIQERAMATVQNPTNLVHLQRDKMSSDDLLIKFDEIVKRFRCEFHEIIERAKMKAEVDGYNAEKQRM
jgi:hypothetical protein